MVTIEPSTIHRFDMMVDFDPVEGGGKIEVEMEDVGHSYDERDKEIIYLRFKFVINTVVPSDEIDGYMERTYKVFPHSKMTGDDLYACVVDGGKMIEEMLTKLYGETNKLPEIVLEVFEDDFFPSILEEIRESQN